MKNYNDNQTNRLPEFPQSIIRQFDLVNQDVDWTKNPLTVMLTVMRRCEELVAKIPSLIADEVEKKLMEAENFNSATKKELSKDLQAVFYGGNILDDGILGQLKRTHESYQDNLSKIQAQNVDIGNVSNSMTKRMDNIIVRLNEWLGNLNVILREDRSARQDQLMKWNLYNELQKNIEELNSKVQIRDSRINELKKEVENNNKEIGKRDENINPLKSENTDLRLGFWGRLWSYLT